MFKDVFEGVEDVRRAECGSLYATKKVTTLLIVVKYYLPPYGYCFNRETNFWRNFATLGATTAAQYGWLGLLAKYS